MLGVVFFSLIHLRAVFELLQQLTDAHVVVVLSSLLSDTMKKNNPAVQTESTTSANKLQDKGIKLKDNAASQSKSITSVNKQRNAKSLN